MTAEVLLRQARVRLAGNNVEDAHLEAEVLLRHILGLSRAQLFADPHRDIGDDDETRYRQLVERRVSGEPGAYICGHREFYGLDFDVDRRVLIPRPESELLVDKALALGHGGAATFADIGTGCGALAISVAVNLPGASVYATDISEAALDVARSNCCKHGVQHTVRLLQGDLVTPLPHPVDVILANLPYVRELDLPRVSTSGFEPALALNGGDDGLQPLRRLTGQVGPKLNPGGALLLEIGLGQDLQAAGILREHFPRAVIDVTADMAGIARVLAVMPG